MRYTARSPAAPPLASVVDFVERQLDALPAVAPVATPEEGREESAASVDAPATLARAERHAAELARATPSAPAIYEQQFVDFIDSLGLANISGVEITAVHKRVASNGAKNTLPPPWGAPRVALLAIRDQLVRDDAGKPLRYSSIHRVDAYNRAIGGASKSAHRACIAADRIIVGLAASKLHAIDVTLRGERIVLTADQRAAIVAWMRAHGLTSPLMSGAVFGEPFSASGVAWNGLAFTNTGGLGKYRTFVHADLRGQRADWTG